MICVLITPAAETQASEVGKQALYSEQSKRHLLDTQHRSI